MDTGNRLPNSMKQIVFKELMELVYKLKSENNAMNKTAVLTPAGLIVGDITPCTHENEMIKFTDDPEKFTLDTSSIFDIMSKQYSSDCEECLYSDAYMVNVQNAVLYKQGFGSENVKMDQIILFADQIVGFSLVRQ